MNTEAWIRTASEADAEQLLEIYRPYVENTAITFEYEVPSVEEFAGRIKNTLKPNIGMAASRTPASSRLMRTTKNTAMTSISGERSIRRIDIMMTCWMRLMSLVRRVISEAVLNRSMSKKESCCILPKMPVRRSDPKPMDAWEDT